MEADRSFGSPIRKRAFLGVAAIVFSAFATRLVQLQIIEGSEYRSRSEAQGIKQVVREPIRGAIYDRYGHPIVANVPAYTVLVTPNKITVKSKLLLANILATDTNTLNDKIKQYKTNDYSPVRIWRDVDQMAWARLNELHLELEGVDIVEESKRAYAGTIRASHILGYTKEISKDELSKMGDYYIPGDVIGKSGVEASYEYFLRGVKGYEFVAVNNRGQRVNTFNDGKNDITPNNGFDITLGIDGGLQQYAEQLLKGYHAAVVAIDPSNGEVLAMVSAPDYDPNTFSGVTSLAEYAKLRDDPSKPLLNRATQAAYPPGSTWKPLMSIAGLTEGLVTPSTTISCPGHYTYGGHFWKCDGVHHTVGVKKAIQASCDVYYYKLSVAMGIDMYHKWGKLFGFGERTGLDFDESPWTLLPSREYYDKRFGKNKWPKGVLVNLGIGQGELAVSPLQLASYCATLANRGTWHQPHLIRHHKNNQLGTYEKFKYESEDLHIRQDIMQIVHEAMIDVVNAPGGTAYALRDTSLKIAGKTGTAQAPGHKTGVKDHSWFISYAPYDNPKIAMCVLVENVGFGSQYAAPISKKLLRYFLTRQKDPADVRENDYDQNNRRLESLPTAEDSTVRRAAASRPPNTSRPAAASRPNATQPNNATRPNAPRPNSNGRREGTDPRQTALPPDDRRRAQR
jgi:penicillin-binding protein 2